MVHSWRCVIALPSRKICTSWQVSFFAFSRVDLFVKVHTHTCTKYSTTRNLTPPLIHPKLPFRIFLPRQQDEWVPTSNWHLLCLPNCRCIRFIEAIYRTTCTRLQNGSTPDQNEDKDEVNAKLQPSDPISDWLLNRMIEIVQKKKLFKKIEW